jgi:ABC-2 type transport system ATP-binding protein
MRAQSIILSLTLLGALVAGCTNDGGPGDQAGAGASGGGPGDPAGAGASGGVKACRQAATESRSGAQQHVTLASNVDGVDVSFEVFEPDQVVAGQTYPLVLHGHGYGGSRQTTRDGFVARLTAAGYYVISIDQRGFGDAGGAVRVLSPDFEGQDLVQILDWAEDLPGVACDGTGNMVLGSYGGSYGGGYQLLLLAVDPRRRLDALAPDMTWNDLTYSLNPNNVIKSGWDLALAVGGESGSQLGQDMVIRETLLNAILTNNFPEGSFNFFRYHSLKYFCDGQPAGPQNFLLATPDPLGVPPVRPPKADVLLTQGFRDTLFNFNEGYANYGCLKALGGDVRLVTHQSGHILPVSVATLGLEDPLDPLYALLTLPGFQDPGGTRSCGSRNLDDVQFAWFEEKLRGQKGTLDAVLTTGRNVCLSLAEGDAIEVADVSIGGTPYAVSADTPQLNSLLGVVGSLLGSGVRELLVADVPLFTAPAGGAVVAGIPTMDLAVAGLTGLESDQCPVPLGIGACDPIFFLAIGHRKAGAQRWDVIDDQLTPIRGFGAHTGHMNGIAERLAEGDELALLIYAFHAQYPITWSRDLLVPAVNISGAVNLPILQPAAIVREGV